MGSDFYLALQKSLLGDVNEKSRQLHIRAWYDQ